MAGKQCSDPGADHRAHASDQRTPDSAGDAGAKLALATATHSSADSESSSQPHKRANNGALAPSPSRPDGIALS
jgi:hypothetical protein